MDEASADGPGQSVPFGADDFHQIVLTRKQTLVEGMPTMGTLTAGSLSLKTLELPWNNNEPQTSCIPVGHYICVLAWSDRYEQLMPRLLKVPGRSGILLHSGNYPGDTHGCILLGKTATSSAVYDSRGAWALFYNWLSKAWAEKIVFLTIENEKATA